MHHDAVKSRRSEERAWSWIRALAWMTGLALIPFSNGAGCAPQTPPVTDPSVTSPTAAGTLIQGQAGSIVLSCLASEVDHAIQSVAADLSALGGATAQPLANAGSDQWSWSGVVNPPTSGSINVTLTALDDQGRTGTAQVAISVAAPDPNRLVLDLGNALVIELVKIPAGSFAMGTSSTDAISLYQLGVDGLVQESGWSNACRPVHTVTFAQAFYMGKFTITQAQWIAVMGSNPSSTTGDPNRPVESVTWDEAVGFCQALSTKVGQTVRLPAEAEWEYACKAGSGDTKYAFGDNESLLPQYAWYVDNSDGSTHPVGQKLPNAWGLHDMHGNVWEWCQDLWHATYDAAPADGSVWSVGGDTAGRVLRGGSIANTPGACRSAFRNRFEPTARYADFGLRIVVGGN